MNAPDLRTLARRYVALGNARDFDGLTAIRTDDFQAHVPRNGPLDDAEPIDGAALNADLKMVVTAFPDLVSEEADILADGDRVMIRTKLVGTHRGALGTVPPTDRVIAWDTVQILRADGGRVAEAWFITDTLGLLRQAKAVTILAAPPDAENAMMQ